ncbi:MFS transporter [Paenibacillus sp. XY044]|uniref:MFS transporter n=1 Tax=Paenibacillus sp. XY044 TaxID=2026089 RepID=UPI000B996A28|nr:MFS transporter [Paenibacillus sp. XY044]OZB96708.1 MFS transporter [Paenibacillus sp. XY044]
MDKRIFILALASFVVGSVELVIAGIMDMIAQDLHVSVGVVGQLVSVYSLVFALGSPILITLTAKVERRKLLVIAMLVFTAGNIMSMLSPNFTVLLLSRIILAASCSIVVVLAITLASGIVTPEAKGRAIGLIFMGISAALVLGVPLGTLIGEAWGWRATFAFIGVLSFVVTICIMKFLPQAASTPRIPMQEQLRSMGNSKVVFAHLVSILQMTGQFTIYAYITPFLQTMLNLSVGQISFVLLVYGLAGIAGGWIGGWASDRFGTARTMIVTLLLHAIAILLLPWAAASMMRLLPVVIVWCAFNMAPSPAIQSYLVRLAPKSADIQLSLNTSALHLGVAAGSAVGGVVISRYEVTANAWIGGLVVILAIVSSIVSLYRGRGVYSKKDSSLQENPS